MQTILLLAIIDYTDNRTQGSWIKVGLAINYGYESVECDFNSNMNELQTSTRLSYAD